MRIVIDLQGAQTESRTRGIGRYSLAFAEGVARNRGRHDILIALNDAFPETIEPIRQAFRGIIPQENIRVWRAPGPVRGVDSENADRRRRAEAIYEAFLVSLDPDAILVTSLFEGYGDDSVTSVDSLRHGIPTVVVFYDLIPLHNPDRFLRHTKSFENWYYLKVRNLKNASLLLAISDFVAADGAERLNFDVGNIVSISSACSDIFKRTTLPGAEKKETFKELGISRDVILTSGTVDPHKNLAGLFRAFAALPSHIRRRHQIVLPGRLLDSHKDMLWREAESIGLTQDELVMTGYVSDEQLIVLLNACKLMVFPSWDEGFGLPALEAMSCGAPTLGGRAASVPQVIGRDDALFDPHDTKSMARLIERGLTDDAFRESLTKHALAHSRSFSWDKTAKSALREIERVAGSSSGRRRAHDPLGLCLEAIAEHPAYAEEKRALATALAWCFPAPSRQRRLFVDVSMLVHVDSRTGCQRVAWGVLLEWLKAPPMGVLVEPVYALMESKGYLYARKFTAKTTGQASTGNDDPIDYAPGDVFIGLDLQPQVVPAQSEALGEMKRRGVDVRFLVYDLLPVQLPHLFPEGADADFSLWLETVAQSGGIIGISRATADAFKHWRSENVPDAAPGFRFDYAALGADIENSAPTKGLPGNAKSVLSALKHGKEVFLMVGTIEPRKGHAQTLAAFNLLWAEGAEVNLVFVGKQGWGAEELVQELRGHQHLGKHLFWLEGISDEYLEKVYGTADCLIAASAGEGFGLPLIEAARHDVPILARDIPVFREVAGENAAYFEGKTPALLAKAVRKWLEAFHANTHPRPRGLTTLTWAESARQMARILLSPPLPEEDADVPGVVFEPVSGFKPQRKRILITKLDHIGDLMLAQPAFSRLRARYPDARLEIVVGSWNVQMAEDLGLFDKVFAFDLFGKKSAQAPELREEAYKALAGELGHYDIAMDLRRQPDSRFFIAGVSAALKVGYRTGDAKIDSCLGIGLRHWADTPFIKTRLNARHISEQMLALVDALPNAINDFVRLPAQGAESAATEVRGVALFPRAGNAIKDWGDGNFRWLADRLVSSGVAEEVNVYFTSEAEADEAGFSSEGRIRVHVGLDMNALSRSVARNRICLANNSLGVHLASMLGVTVVGIYGGHETAAEWYPVFGDNYVIRRPLYCSPCHLADRASCRENLACLDIDPQFVYRKVAALLAETEQTAPRTAFGIA